MKIKVKVGCAGAAFAFSENEIVEATEEIAKSLIACGYAEEIVAKEATKKEMAKAKANNPENA